MTPTSLLIDRSSFGSCCIALPLPPVPILDLASEQAGVRQAIEPAYAAAKAYLKHAVTINRLGMLLHAHNLLGAAALPHQRAAALDPGQPDSSYYLGTVLAATGKYTDALVPLRSSLKLREAVAVRLRLADTLFEAGKPVDARHEYETLIAA